VQNQGLWLLSGLDSGGINLQSVRHEEGKRIYCLKKHTSAVSVLNLAQDERSVLSGSWDKTVLDWDLETGLVKRTFADGAGQISALEMRPLSTLPVPETNPLPVVNGTLSSNNEDKPQLTESNGNEDLPNGVDSEDKPNAGALSPVDSLFGGGDDDDLFGENNDIAPPVALGDDDDNEFSRAMAQDLQQDATQDSVDVSMADAAPADNAHLANGVTGDATTRASDGNADLVQPKQEKDDDAMDGVVANGLPHTADDNDSKEPLDPSASEPAAPEQTPTADTTFLAASIDGTIRIWDKRQSTPVAKIVPRNTPPWCMGACWSPDGNNIYAGRRNGTVEEYNLHKGLRQAERTFRFPNGSGPVSAVRAMPNGRHLVW
jgi:transcriptional activator SPT8